MTTAGTTSLSEQLKDELSRRILVLDGAMGTMVQALGLDEESMRGDRFRDHHKDLNRFSDILCLTRADDQVEIHRKYLQAGADIVSTNTFGASFGRHGGVRTAEC